MPDLTDLLGDDLAQYVIQNNVRFTPGWRKKPDNLQHYWYFSMKIVTKDNTIQVRYYPGIRFLKWDFFSRTEIIGNPNGQAQALCERIGNLLERYGGSYHRDLSNLSLYERISQNQSSS